MTSDAYWRETIRWNAEAERLGRRMRVFVASLADVMDHEAPAGARERLFELIRQTPYLDWLILTKRPQNFRRFLPWMLDGSEPYPNVWLGVSVENRTEALRRIPILRQTPATLRFISAEPLLGELGNLDLAGVHWTICGGESGGGARSMDLQWALNLHEQCRSQDVAFFMKQLGSQPTENGRLYQITRGKGGNLPEMPASLRVRDLPLINH
jgi:protein gp37